MDEAHREALRRTRTIFRSNGKPHYEDLHTMPELWWVSVKLTDEQRHATDDQLMDIVIERCRTGDCKVTHYDSMHQQEAFWISFPVMNPDQDLAGRGWIVLVMGLAEHYQMEIAAGRLSVDRDYIFGARDSS